MTEIEETDLCILCNSPPPPGSRFDARKSAQGLGGDDNSGGNGLHGLETKRESGFKPSFYQDQADLRPQLRVIFLLQQIFKYPMQDESTLTVMQALGDPSKWVQICSRCSELVDSGIDVYRKMKLWEEKYMQIRRELEMKVSVSLSPGSIEKIMDFGNYVLVRNEQTEESRVRLNLRRKLRGINDPLNYEIKLEADVMQDLEDNSWAPGEDDGFGGSSLDFIEPSKNGDLASFEIDLKLPIEPMEMEPICDDQQTTSTGVLEKETIKRPGLRVRQKRAEVVKKKRRYQKKNACRSKDDSSGGGDGAGNESHLASICTNDKPDATQATLRRRRRKKKRSTDWKPKPRKRVLKKPARVEKVVEPEDYSYPSCDEKDDPDFSLSGDDKDDTDEEEWRPVIKRREVGDDRKTMPKKPEEKRNFEEDTKLFYEKCPQYLDMSFFVYPPQSEEEKVKIPKGKKLKVKGSDEEGRVKYGAFPCPSCNTSFNNKFLAIAHIHRIHLGIRKPWRCDQCLYKSSRARFLRRHFQRHEVGSLKICQICNFSCLTQTRMDNHVIDHQKGVSNPTCAQCQTTFGSFIKYAKHMVNEHGFQYNVQCKKKELVCELCSKVLNSQRHLEFHKFQNHNEVELAEKFPACSECNRIFISDGSLKHHVESSHAGEKFFCEHCGQDFKTLPLLSFHMKSRHVEEPQECRVCGMQQLNSIILRNHMTRNHSETLAMSSEELEEYVKKKKEEMAFKCSRCAETFAFSILLYHHYRENHEDATNKYKCDVCGKGFSRQSSVKRHYETSHVKVKANCEDCGKEFAAGDSLAQHRRLYCSVKKKKEQELLETGMSTQFQEQVESTSAGMEYQQWVAFQPAEVVSNILYQENPSYPTYDTNH